MKACDSDYKSLDCEALTPEHVSGMQEPGLSSRCNKIPSRTRWDWHISGDISKEHSGKLEPGKMWTPPEMSVGTCVLQTHNSLPRTQFPSGEGMWRGMPFIEDLHSEFLKRSFSYSDLTRLTIFLKTKKRSCQIQRTLQCHCVSYDSAMHCSTWPELELGFGRVPKCSFSVCWSVNRVPGKKTGQWVMQPSERS